jgi:hypothetical protein
MSVSQSALLTAIKLVYAIHSPWSRTGSALTESALFLDMVGVGDLGPETQSCIGRHPNKSDILEEISFLTY